MNLLVTGGLLKRIEDILGKGLTGNLLEIKSEGKVFKIYGFIGKPALSRLDKKGQFFFVNGRAVANRSLAHAVFSAYEEFLPKERFPLAIVYIEIGPQLVDVNVHPAKREVRFQNERLIHDSLRQVIRDCFLSNSLIPRVELSSVSTEETGKIAEQPSAYPQQGSYSLFKETGSSFPAVLLRKTPFLQISNLYILTSDEEGILIVDQHAASERIIFDLLCKEKQNREIQRLLIPEVIDLGHEESYILKENLQELKSIGFELEEFGKNSFQIRSVPAAVYNKSPRQIILDLISEIVQGQETKTLKLAREKLIALIACHSAIREGDCLGDLELSRLLQDLKTSASAYTCPHGRPTMIRLSWAELKKKFKRT